MPTAQVHLDQRHGRETNNITFTFTARPYNRTNGTQQEISDPHQENIKSQSHCELDIVHVLEKIENEQENGLAHIGHPDTDEYGTLTIDLLGDVMIY